MKSIGGILIAVAMLAAACNAVGAAAEPSYGELVLKDQPIAYYRMDESAGVTATDATGNGHDGVYEGELAVGQSSAFAGLGSAVQFGGKDGCLRIPRHDAFKFGKGDFSIEFWFNCRETLSTRGDIFTYKGEGKDFGILKPFGNSNLIAIARPYKSFQAQTDPFSIGVWHHGVYVRRSGIDRWYLDGAPSGPSTGHEQAIDMNVDILIGANHYGDTKRIDPKTSWNGLIDEVAIYGHALTQQQIEAHLQTAKQSAR